MDIVFEPIDMSNTGGTSGTDNNDKYKFLFKITKKSKPVQDETGFIFHKYTEIIIS